MYYSLESIPIICQGITGRRLYCFGDHTWRGGDEGKRGEKGEGGRDDKGHGRERNDLLGPLGCALVARRAAREDGWHCVIVRCQGE
jgi:hypothetical protein